VRPRCHSINHTPAALLAPSESSSRGGCCGHDPEPVVRLRQ
jgi:hypothetical protein